MSGTNSRQAPRGRATSRTQALIGAVVGLVALVWGIFIPSVFGATFGAIGLALSMVSLWRQRSEPERSQEGSLAASRLLQTAKVSPHRPHGHRPELSLTKPRSLTASMAVRLSPALAAIVALIGWALLSHNGLLAASALSTAALIAVILAIEIRLITAASNRRARDRLRTAPAGTRYVGRGWLIAPANASDSIAGEPPARAQGVISIGEDGVLIGPSDASRPGPAIDVDLELRWAQLNRVVLTDRRAAGSELRLETSSGLTLTWIAPDSARLFEALNTCSEEWAATPATED